jgi:deoxyribonuclease-4
MTILGAHMSIAGGYYKAIERAKDAGCNCVQLFTKSNKMWRAKTLTDEDCQRFTDHLQKLNITHPISHSSYLINLGSPDQALWNKSVDAFVIELQRADRMGIPWVVVHPGSYVSSSERQGMRRIIRALNKVGNQTGQLSTGVLLETTAGQGTNLGWRFEHLAEMLDGVQQPARFGICFDTCHVFAAGYPLSTEKEYKATMREFNKLIGVKRIKAFHLNDSQRELGSRRDRHEHIGKGKIGKEAFRLLLNDRRFKKIPMYLETPKEDDTGKNLDQMNLRTLRRLVSK